MFRRWQNGKAIAHTQLAPGFHESFGAPFYVVHGAHYHQALYEQANELGVEVKVKRKVVNYDMELPSVQLADETLSQPIWWLQLRVCQVDIAPHNSKLKR